MISYCYTSKIPLTLARETFDAIVYFHEVWHMVHHEVHVGSDVIALMPITFDADEQFYPFNSLTR